MTDESIFACSVTDLDEHNDFYPKAHEALPGKLIEPLGNPVRFGAYVDANHAGDTVNSRSHTGCIIYINNYPVVWYYSKR